MVTQHYQAKRFRGRGSIGYLLRHAHLGMSSGLDAVMSPHGLNSTQWVLLMHLRESESCSAGTLCERLRYDSGALTRVIDQLEARGWVQRERSAEDRRSVELSLTRAGHAALDELIPAAVERLNWSLREFSRAEVAELSRLLGKLIDGSGRGEDA